MRGRGSNVLVAEDEPDTLHALERMLRREGYSVEGAKDGLEAAERLKTEDFDVIVSDLRMPVVDGMDLLHLAKEKDRGVVFIMITAYGTAENAVEAMKLGSSDYIAKPFDPGDLLGAIEKGLVEKGQATPAGAPRPEAALVRAPAERAWIAPQPDGTVLIGADREFYEEAGDVVFCDLPFPGDEIARGDRCARTINSTGLVQRPFHCPLSGVVVEVNEKMMHEPGDAPHDPYGDGWLFRMSPSKFEEEIGEVRSCQGRSRTGSGCG